MLCGSQMLQDNMCRRMLKLQQSNSLQRGTWMIQSGVRPMRSILSSSFAFASASSISVFCLHSSHRSYECITCTILRPAWTLPFLILILKCRANLTSRHTQAVLWHSDSKPLTD